MLVSRVPQHAPTKQDLRERTRRSRLARSETEQELSALRFRDQLLALPEVSTAARVAAFVALAGEPETRPFIDALYAAQVEVVLPILLDDLDLDWGRYEPGELTVGRFGLHLPTTRTLGRHAVATASVVVCPGVAVDRAGNRLGRGGGSYDRALARCGPDVLRVQLVYDDEVVDTVPVDEHDQPVDAIVTPTKTIRVVPVG